MIDSVYAGNTVYLRADAAEMEGQTISVELWEDDGIGDDRIATVSITIGAQGFGVATWQATWQGADEDDPFNRYYLFYDAPWPMDNVYSGSPDTGHFLIRPPLASGIYGVAYSPLFVPNSSSVFLERFQSAVPIDPELPTWVIIHGRVNSSSTPAIVNLADAVDDFREGDQVLMLDWADAAYELGVELGSHEDWIQPVATWAANTLHDLGFSPGNLNLIGHSWGANLADELAERIGTVNTIVALDPAMNGLGLYNPNDGFDTPDTSDDQIHFGRDSAFSWAFYSWGGVWGNKETPTTADEAIVVTNSDHSKVVNLFSYMLEEHRVLVR